jgi:hypothetical protein
MLLGIRGWFVHTHMSRDFGKTSSEIYLKFALFVIILCNRSEWPGLPVTAVICIISQKLERDLRHGQNSLRHMGLIYVMFGRLICTILHHSAQIPLG